MFPQRPRYSKEFFCSTLKFQGEGGIGSQGLATFNAIIHQPRKFVRTSFLTVQM